MTSPEGKEQSSKQRDEEHHASNQSTTIPDEHKNLRSNLYWITWHRGPRTGIDNPAPVVPCLSCGVGILLAAGSRRKSCACTHGTSRPPRRDVLPPTAADPLFCFDLDSRALLFCTSFSFFWQICPTRDGSGIGAGSQITNHKQNSK